MRLTGTVRTWDPKEWLGTIEADEKFYIVRRNGLKRGSVLAEGQSVTFVPVFLFAGPTAENICVMDS
jgi:cold shock CspA family protein